MQEFYRNLLNGMPKGAALAAARSALVSKDYTSPFFWARHFLRRRGARPGRVGEHHCIHAVPTAAERIPRPATWITLSLLLQPFARHFTHQYFTVR
jgi:hypothetical protein